MSVIATILGGLIGTVASVIALAVFNVGWWSAVAVYFIAGSLASSLLIWRGMREGDGERAGVVLSSWMDELGYEPVPDAEMDAEILPQAATKVA